MIYAAANDPLCYPGTTVLINRADLTSQQALDDFELAMTLIGAEEPWPAGALDAAHYRALHHHMFQDVYDWAGQIRTIRIGKAGNWFCYPEHIESELSKLFAWLANEMVTPHGHVERFRNDAVHLISELNAIHPFRDGNGRTQMAYLALLTERCGFRFVDDALKPDEVMSAVIDSFVGKAAGLRGLMQRLIMPG